MKNILKVFLMLTAAGLVFAGGKKDSGSMPGTVTITISNWLDAEEATSAVFREMLDDFMKANPGIKVESLAIPFNQYNDQVLIAGASNNAADVIMGNSQMMVSFNGAGLLADLSPLVDKAVIDDIFPNNLKGTTFDGRVAALSWAPHPLALYYNTDLFRQAGLDPDSPPKTWDELARYAEAIAKLGKDSAGNTIYGFATPTGKVAHTGQVMNGIFYAFGGQFQDENGRIVLNSRENAEAIRFLKDLVDRRIMPGGLEIKDIRGLFASGQIGMIIDGDMGRGAFRASSGLGNEFDKKMGVAIIPVGKTGKSETVYTEHELGIFKGSKHPQEAAKLVEYLLSPEAMLKYHASNGVLSARKSIASLPEMNEDYFMEVFNKQSETASPLPATHPMFGNATNEITKAMERIIVNNENIETVLRETEAKIKTMYGQ